MFTFLIVFIHILPSYYASFVINEVGPNYNQNSFIELYSKNGIAEGTQLYYGVAVLRVANHKAQVKALFELPREEFEEQAFYFTIGTPKTEWYNEASSKKGVPLVGGNRQHVKIFGSINDWLNVNFMVAVILVQSNTPFTNEWPSITSNRISSVDLEEEKTLKIFLLVHQIDAIILKKHGVARGCPPLVNCVAQKMTPPVLYTTLGAERPQSPFSKNRCLTWKPFDHSGYNDGNVTPGLENDCSKPTWHADPTDFLNVVPSSEVQSNYCGNQVDMRRISDDQINADDMAQDHYNTITGVPSSSTTIDDQPSSSSAQQSTSEPSEQSSTSTSCSSTRSNLLSSRMAETYIAVKKGEAKRARIAVDIDGPATASNAPASNSATSNAATSNAASSSTPPDSALPINLTPTEVERYMKVKEAVANIKEHQADKLGGQLIQERYWRWFQYLFDEFEPEDSKFNCEFCAKHLEGTRHSNALSTKDGILHNRKDVNMQALRRHEGTDSHKLAMQVERREWASNLGFVIEEDLKRKEDEVNQITNRHFKLVFYATIHYMSFNAHPSLVELLETEADMGQGCRTPKAAKRMANFMSRVIKDDLFALMRKSTSPIFLICDGSEDLSQNHFFVTIFQWVGKFKFVGLSKAEQGRPKVDQAKRL